MSYTLKEYRDIGEKVYYRKHKSGLDVYYVPKQHSNTYAIFGTKYGSVDVEFKVGDGDFISVPDGVAHFLEHKLFEDENGNDAFARYAAFGGNANAYTSFGRTCYLFSCTENFEQNLEILLDFVTHPYFSDKSVAKEQGIIAEEIKMGEDNPARKVYFGMLRALYHNHPLRIEVAGSVDSIMQITPKLLYDCYNTFYNLRNMALVVCGDTDTAVIDTVCDKILKTAPEQIIERVRYDEPDTVCMKRVCACLPVSRPIFNIGIKEKAPAKEEDIGRKSAVYEIILQIIFGKSGEFYNNMYEEGLLNSSFGAYFGCASDYAYIEIGGESDEPDEVMNRVCEEIVRRKESLFSVEEFERAKKVVYANNLFALDSTDDVASSFLEHRLAGTDFFEYFEHLAKVSFDEAKSMLLSGFDIEKTVISIVENNAE